MQEAEVPDGLRQSTLGILRDDSNTPRLLEQLPIMQSKLKLSEGKLEAENDSDYYDDYISSSAATEKPDSTPPPLTHPENALQIKSLEIASSGSGKKKAQLEAPGGGVESTVEQIKFGFFNEVESPTSTPRGQHTDHHSHQDDEEEEAKTKSTFSVSQVRSSLPQAKLQASFAISSSEIMKVFEEVCRAKSFQIIEMEELLATAVYREPFSLKKLFSYCLPSKGRNSGRAGSASSSSMVSAIKLHIHVSESTLSRKIYVKGFYGVVPILKGFVKEFKRKMQKEIDRVDVSEETSFEKPRRDSAKNVLPKRSNERRDKNYSQIEAAYSDDEGEDGSAMNQTLREKSSKYEFQKILSS